MSFIEHAKTELKLIGYTGEEPEDDINRWAYDSIMELVETFAKQEHSGSSAPYVANLAYKLMMFEPLSPLTGEDYEWNYIGDGYFQNRRDSAIFKKDSKAYWIEGRIFWSWMRNEETGEIFQSSHTNRDSRVPVEFPWTRSEREYVFVPSDEFPNEELEL